MFHFLVLLFLVQFGASSGLTSMIRPITKQLAKCAVIATVASSLLPGTSIAAETEPSIASQLAAIQASEVLQNQGRLDAENGKALARELQLPQYELIARGIITLSKDKIDTNMYPIGFSDASMIDEKYNSDNTAANLIILGVGREGGAPLAAKKVPLKGLKFPYVFTLEASNDLLFPYTKKAWEESGNSKDTVAISAFIVPQGKLAIPDTAVRVGFGLSDPVQMAGVLTRSTAQVKIQNKLDGKLYTDEEVSVLSTVDRGLADRK